MSSRDPYAHVVHYALLVLIVTAGPASADDRLSAGVRACAAVSDDDERLTCFDALAAAIADDAPAVAVAATPAAASAAPPPLTDDVGKPQTDEPGEAPETYAATVARCEKNDATNRWYFYLENGQVWRQSNTGRLRFRDCAFDVTLQRDLFGYKMAIPSEDKTVRVSRVE